MGTTPIHTRYKVSYERDESGWWIARLHGVAGVHSNGRTIADARRRVRDALALALDDDRAADQATLIDDVLLPSSTKKTLARATAARKRADEHALSALRETAAAVHELRHKLGLSADKKSNGTSMRHRVKHGTVFSALGGPAEAPGRVDIKANYTT